MSNEPRVYRRGFQWYYDLRIGPKQRERKGCGPHRDKAIAAAQARLQELRGEGADAPPTPIRTAPGSSVWDLFQAYLKHLRATSQKPNTWRSAESASHALVRVLGTTRDARRLTEDMLVSYAEERRRGDPGSSRSRKFRPVTDATIHGELAVLRACLNWAVHRRLLKQLPCEVPMPKVAQKAKIHLSPERVEQLLDLAHEPRVRAFLALGYFAGLRRDETLHLRWEGINLDPEAGAVHVEAVGTWTPKTHQDRFVPLNDRLREELARWRAVCPESPWVFPSKVTKANPDGRWSSPDRDLRDVFTAFRKATGMRTPRNHYHWLRSAFVSELIGQGVDVVTASELGGWKDPSTVFRFYAKADPVRMRAAIQKLGRKAS